MTTNLLISKPGIPARATRTRAVNAYATDYALKNVKQGQRHNLAMLADGATFEHIEYDLGPGATEAVDHLIIARADMLKEAGCTGVILTGSDASYHTPLEVTTLPTLWLKSDAGVTIDTANRCSQWDDQSGNGRNAVQATDAAKFVLSRSDNRENRVMDSELTSADTTWAGGARAGFVPATTVSKGGKTLVYLKENATAGNTHYGSQTTAAITTVSGLSYKVSMLAFSETRDISIRLLTGFAGGYTTIDLSNGSVIEQAAEVTAVAVTAQGDGSYLIELTATANATAANANVIFYLYNASRVYDGDDTSGVYLGAVHFRSTLADPTYTPTTTYPQFRGLNGRPVLVASGAQQMATTETLNNIFSNGAKTVFVVCRPQSTARQILIDGSSSNPYLDFLNNQGKAQWADNDGGWQGAVTSNNWTANAVQIAEALHDAGTISCKLNNGTAGTDGCGDSANLSAKVLRIGGVTIGVPFIGDICEILTYNVALSSADRAAVYAYLDARWKTAQTYQDMDFANATLSGPNSADLLAVVSTSTAYRYWWIEYFASAACTFPRSKEYFGQFVDVGQHPSGFSYATEIPSERTRLPYGSTIAGRGISPTKSHSIEWGKITDANAEIVLDDLCDSFANRVFLYTPTNLEILGNAECIHASIEPGSVELTRQYTDKNALKMTFKQERG